MKITSEMLEAAAKAAEEWPEDVCCSTHWAVDKSNAEFLPEPNGINPDEHFLWPAAAAAWVAVGDTKKLTIQILDDYFDSLWHIKKDYTALIDGGNGKKVAELFRAYKDEDWSKGRRYYVWNTTNTLWMSYRTSS